MSNKEEINPLFTKENVDAIFVPNVVKEDLCSILEEKLKKTGFYYRVAYRVKTSDSILSKMIRRNYGAKGSDYEHKKLQDLVGIRIMLYFDDDMSILRTLLDSLFSEPGEWETTETTVYEFHATKINGTFKMPGYLSNMIVNPALGDYVDDTFEIQVRTNAFEGWHEVEHDLHYKGSAFDVSNETLARRMNSILATLELCDDSIVNLLEDLGHQHYKDKNWEDMVRCHFRVKLSSEPLWPEIIECLNENNELAKTIFKFSRSKLLEYLWKKANENDEHTVSMLIKAINEVGPRDEKLFEIFAENSVKKTNVNKRKKFEPFKLLGKFPVFVSNVDIVNDKGDIEESFDKASSYIYSWVKSRLHEVFPDLPENISSYDNDVPGYRIILNYDRDKLFFSEMTTHPDSNVANRIWISNAKIEEKGGKLKFSVTNHFAEPLEKYRDPENGLFSRPNFYGEIADNIGIVDVDRLKEGIRYVNEDNIDDLYDLIYSGRRRFPVIVFIVTDKSWADKFDIDFFAFLVGYYAHVRVIEDEDVQKAFAKECDMDEKLYGDSITVFYRGEPPVTSYKRDILETSFEVIKYETKKYWNEKGCSAFRRQLIAQIREKMVEKQQPENGYIEHPDKPADNGEIWDICDRNGKSIGNTMDRADAKTIKNGFFHKVISVYTVSKDGKVLVTRRSGSKSHPHKWEVTCGSILSGESVEEGAIRELLEETGIERKAEELKPIYVHVDDKRHCIYYGFLNLVDSSEMDIKLMPEEIDQYRFMELSDFYDFIKSSAFVKSESGRFVVYEENIKSEIKKILKK